MILKKEQDIFDGMQKLQKYNERAGNMYLWQEQQADLHSPQILQRFPEIHHKAEVYEAGTGTL